MIPAHDSPLAALAFDASGTKLATASEKVTQLLYSTLACVSYLCVILVFPAEQMQITVVASPPSLVILCASFTSSQGTVIRVFSIPEGQKLFEFRRGVKR